MSDPRPDSLAWTAAKAHGDAAEVAIAAFWRSRGFMAHRAVGLADHDLRVTADVEVKRDLLARETGHVAIEVAYAGKPSGILATGADWWAIVIDNTAYMIRADRLRNLALDKRWREVDGGDGGRSRLRLVPVSELAKATRHVIQLPGSAA